jgi:hypothetical protein
MNLDERRPRAFEAFAGQFLCRVDAQSAADGDFARRVVEHIGRASRHFGFRISDFGFFLRVGAGVEAEDDFAGVMKRLT